MRQILLVVVGLLLSAFLMAQQAITGTVKDGNGDPLPAASVTVRGTSNTVQTNDQGQFSIRAVQGAVLQAKVVGFDPENVIVEGNLPIHFVLYESLSSLDEVVVIGYQSVTKKKNTAAISSISGKELENIPAASFESILQGRLAGVNMQNLSGSPGGVSTVYVRGSTGISTSYDEAQVLSSPLYVVDGVPQPTEQYSNLNTGTGTSYLAGINPNDIESIEVLRDASAAAIYGSRAANGVVLITTKKGTNREPRVIVTGYTGMTVRPELRDVALGSAERRQKMAVFEKQLTYAERANLPILLTDSLNPAFNGNTNWQDLFYQRGKVNNADLSISGGSDNSNYRFSANIYDEDGVVKATGFQRMSTRLNLMSKALKGKLTINPIVAYTYMDRARGNIDEDDISPFPLGASSMPSSLYNPSEDYVRYLTEGFDEDLDNNITNQLALNLNLNAQLLPELTFVSQTSFNYNTGKRNYNMPSRLNGEQGNYVYAWSSTQENYLLSNYLTYIDTYGKHSLTVLAGQDIQHDKYEQLEGSGNFGQSDQIQVVQGFLQNYISSFSDYQAWGLLSYYSRLSYDFDSRYIFSGSIRTDGSSRFGKNNQWGWFPAASAAWLLSEESFLKDHPSISLLKIRGSYGATGNLPRENYLAYNLYSVNNGGYAGATAGSYNGVSAITPNFTNGVAQDNLTWEKSQSWNIGVDMDLLNGRWSFSADVYNKETSNQLFAVQLPTNTGYDYAQTNAVGVRNAGVELIVNGSPLPRSSKLNWRTNFNISYNKNAIMSLPNGGRDLVMSGDRFDKSHILSVGSPINAFYLYETLGVYSTINDVPINPYTGELFRNSNGTYGEGMFQFRDVDGDYFTDVFNSGINPDKIPMGDPNPKWYGGWTNTFSYKNFDFSVFINFTLDRDVLNLYESDVFGANSAGSLANVAGLSLPDLSKYNIWTQPGNQAEYAKIDIGTYRYYYTSAQSFFLESGSYVRLKNVILSYRLGQQFLQRFGISQFRIYGLVDNALTWKASGKLPDAEAVNQYGEYNGNGYPIPRKFTLGVEITL